ncbi:unnamed protein product [Candida verbasci]|uniref:Uncharacterized protein n=1 Tax=Candida verbasci TaxID=1227364 RepID=A0A9W4TZQ6_9ASCO|nr:unnamed protein product [Candida verbasci]
MLLLEVWTVILLPSLIFAAIVPFRDSIEVVFTPDDIKKSADYVLWKVPTVKNNFKTTVKQKLLNRLLDKDLQDFKTNPYLEDDELKKEKNNEDDSEVVAATNKNGNFKSIKVEIENPYGLISSVMKNPSETEKKKATIKVVENAILKEQQELEEGSENEQVDSLSNKETEHVGYLTPTQIKNRKVSHDDHIKHLPDNKDDKDDFK